MQLVKNLFTFRITEPSIKKSGILNKFNTAGLLKRDLIQKRFFFTTVDDTGGFFFSSTSTIFVGIPSDRFDELMEIINSHCKKQRTHIATQTQIETHFQPSQPIIIEAETGGATILTLPVEHFEQY